MLLFGASTAGAEVLVLTNANLIDGVTSAPRSGVSVVIRDRRIQSVGPTNVPPGATVIDLKGQWLLPGLIDMHVHLPELKNAQRALRSGITTLRALGSQHYIDIGIRELHRSGASDVPDVIAAGYQVTKFPSDSMFLNFPKLRPLYQSGRASDAYAEIVRGNAKHGADVIKVMSTERAGLPEQDPSKRMLSDADLALAVAEARKAGLSVAAHAHTDNGVRAAVLAGARTIEHGSVASDETLRLVKARDACLVPTIANWDIHLDGVNDHPVLAERARRISASARETTGRAAALGVTIAAGSDAVYGENARIGLVEEIMVLAESGLTRMQAIQAATSIAAACAGIGGRTGAVKPGMEADLIVVEQDPTQDLAALKSPLMVINDGAVALDRRP